MNRDIAEENRMPINDNNSPTLLDASSGSDDGIRSRRAVLRGIFAAGCGLLLPSVFAGCDSKQGANAGSSAPTDYPTAETQAATPTANTKVPKASVQYQTQPKGEQKCSACVNFIAASNTCKRVEGDINPAGWCMLWTQKT